MTSADTPALNRRTWQTIAAGVLACGGLVLFSGLLAEHLQRADVTVAGWWWCLLALFVLRASSLPRVLPLFAFAAASLLDGPWPTLAWLVWPVVHRARWPSVVPVILCSLVIWLRPRELVGDAVVNAAWTLCWLMLVISACLMPMLRQRRIADDGGATALLMIITGLRIGTLVDVGWALQLLVLIGAAVTMVVTAARSTRVRTQGARHRLQSAALLAQVVVFVAAGSEAALTVALGLSGIAVWWALRGPASGVRRLELLVLAVSIWAGAAALVAARLAALLPIWLLVWWWLTEAARRSGAETPFRRQHAVHVWLSIAAVPWLLERLATAAAALSVQAAPFGTLRTAAGSGMLVLDSAAQQLAALPLLTLSGGAALIWALLTLLVRQERADD